MSVGSLTKRHSLTIFRILSPLWVLSLTGCPPPPPPPTVPQPTHQVFEFNQGIQHLATLLVKHFDVFQHAMRLQGKSATVPDSAMHRTVLQPFLVADTGESLKLHSIIENLMARVMTPKLGITKMTQEYIDTAAYVIDGIIALESHPATRNKTYRIYASLFEKKAGAIIGSGDVWIQNLDYQPLDIYKDSPVYLKDRELDTLVASVKRPVGQTVDPSYLAKLKTRSLLSEGDTLYEKREWESALPFYQEAERRADGQSMKVYAGLYNIYRLQQEANHSETAFAKLIDVSVKEKNEIAVKLLFIVDTTDFVSNPLELRREYIMWLRQISKYMERTPDVCLRVVGHASRSGKADYNKLLSTRRAQQVQSLMKQTYAGLAKRSEAVGMGFEQTVIGTGVDNESDAIDRRVEFLLKSCESGRRARATALVTAQLETTARRPPLAMAWHGQGVRDAADGAAGAAAWGWGWSS